MTFLPRPYTRDLGIDNGGGVVCTEHSLDMINGRFGREEWLRTVGPTMPRKFAKRFFGDDSSDECDEFPSEPLTFADEDILDSDMVVSDLMKPPGANDAAPKTTLRTVYARRNVQNTNPTSANRTSGQMSAPLQANGLNFGAKLTSGLSKLCIGPGNPQPVTAANGKNSSDRSDIHRADARTGGGGKSARTQSSASRNDEGLPVAWGQPSAGAWSMLTEEEMHNWGTDSMEKLPTASAAKIKTAPFNLLRSSKAVPVRGVSGPVAASDFQSNGAMNSDFSAGWYSSSGGAGSASASKVVATEEEVENWGTDWMEKLPTAKVKSASFNLLRPKNNVASRDVSGSLKMGNAAAATDAVPPAVAPIVAPNAFSAATLRYDASRVAQKAPSLQAEHDALKTKYSEAIGSIDKLSTRVQQLLLQYRKVSDERDEARFELQRKNEVIAQLSEMLERHDSSDLIVEKPSTGLPPGADDEEATTESPTVAFEAAQEPTALEAQTENAVHEKKVAAEKMILGASKFVASGQVDQALELLHGAIALYPSSPAHCLLSLAYVRMKRYPEAYKAAVEGLQLDPDDLNALKMQARCLYLTGHYSKARPILRRVLEAEPDNEPIQKVSNEIESKADNPKLNASFLGL